MSEWIEIDDKDDVSLSDDGTTIDILYNFDENGNKYIEVPVKWVKELLKHDGTCPCGCGEEVPHNRFYYSEKCGVKYRSKVSEPPCRTGKRKIEQMQRRRNEKKKHIKA